MATTPFALFVDWGTSSLRVYDPATSPPALLHSDPAGGVLRVAGGPAGFSAALEAAAAAAGVGAGPALVCGMAGSSRGWAEVPYVDAPADAGAVLEYVVVAQWPDGGSVTVPAVDSPTVGGTR